MNTTVALPTHKTCPTCQTEKPLTEFWKSLKSPNGVQSSCKICQAIRKRGGLPIAPRKPKATKPSPKTKPLPQVDPELAIDIPGIWEIQNRGKNYTTCNFTSPIDQTTFTFCSFKEARQGRQEMMKAFRQQAVFESVHRQSTGKKLAVDEEGNE